MLRMVRFMMLRLLDLRVWSSLDPSKPKKGPCCRATTVAQSSPQSCARDCLWCPTPSQAYVEAHAHAHANGARREIKAHTGSWEQVVGHYQSSGGAAAGARFRPAPRHPRHRDNGGLVLGADGRCRPWEPWTPTTFAPQALAHRGGASTGPLEGLAP